MSPEHHTPMPHPKTPKIANTMLVVVDAQEAFRPAIGDFALAVSNISRAVRGSGILGVPVLVTEQYPRGLGHTAEEITLALPAGVEVLEKTSFSAFGADGFADKLDEHAIRHVLLCGFETHVCVNQTAHDLIDKGFNVHLLTDCIASRFRVDEDAGLEKMRSVGVVPSSVETALFELMQNARHPKFKEIQSLIK